MVGSGNINSLSWMKHHILFILISCSVICWKTAEWEYWKHLFSFSEFITCYLTLPSDRQKKSRQIELRPVQSFSTSTSGIQVLSFDISSVPLRRSSLEFPLWSWSSLSWLWNLYLFYPFWLLFFSKNLTSTSVIWT